MEEVFSALKFLLWNISGCIIDGCVYVWLELRLDGKHSTHLFIFLIDFWAVTREWIWMTNVYHMKSNIIIILIMLSFPDTVKPRYNEVLGTMKITLLHVYQVSHYIRVEKQRNIKNWDQPNYLVIRGFCYIRPLYNEVPLYQFYDLFSILREGGVHLGFLFLFSFISSYCISLSARH